jgi:hypothetical protein
MVISIIPCGNTKAPLGWFCSRPIDHDGPCAAWATRRTCICGNFMVIRSTPCGLASQFYWKCPKDHWYSFSKHDIFPIGTSLPEELYGFYSSKKNCY